VSAAADLPALLVIAKAPAPGRSKTRLCPPCSPQEAAGLAEAALRDTLEAVAATPAPRRVLVLEGEPGAWAPAGFEVIAQRGRGLDERLAAAFEDAGAPALLVGMDTPQLLPTHLAAGQRALADPAVDAVLGPAPDGGYWAIGLRAADRAVFEGVPMSTAATGAAQAARLRELGLRYAELPPLRDVDIFADALAVAAERPDSRFAAALARVEAGRGAVA
jgi:uncharacterized protein